MSINRKARRAAERAARKRLAKQRRARSTAEEIDPLSPGNLSSIDSLPLAAGSELVAESPDDADAFTETIESVGDVPRKLSAEQFAANRANAQLSRGPITHAGKARSSKNALKTALTGRTVLLPDDDVERYQEHLLAYQKSYEPVGERELELVQALADCAWRLDRIPNLEEALYFKGSLEFAEKVAELDPSKRSIMLRMHTWLAYERQFRNLHLQEMRLHRLRDKLNAELKQLQKEREQKEKQDLADAAKLYLAAKHDRQPFDPAEFGFEFSTTDIEAFLRGARAASLSDKLLKTPGR